MISSQDGLEPLLELAAVLRAGHHRGQVEATSRLSAQRLGHVAGDDALGQALDDGGLADAGLADQDGVVLGAPGQHLHDAADLGVAADDRVELAVAGAPAVRSTPYFSSASYVPSGFGGGDLARRRGSAADRPATRPGARASAAPNCAGAGQAEQQVLGGDVVVAHRLHRLPGLLDDGQAGAREGGRGHRGPAGGRQRSAAPCGRVGGGRRGGPGRLEQRPGRGVGLLGQRQQQVGRLDVGVAGGGGVAGCGREGLLRLGGQLQVHGAPSGWAGGRCPVQHRRKLSLFRSTPGWTGPLGPGRLRSASGGRRTGGHAEPRPPVLEAVLGDITTQQVDAIVNAANSGLLGGGGVDGAIHRAAGPALLAECRQVRRTAYPHGLPVGAAVDHRRGPAPARWVIHTVGPNRHAGETDPDLLAACYAVLPGAGRRRRARGRWPSRRSAPGPTAGAAGDVARGRGVRGAASAPTSSSWSWCGSCCSAARRWTRSPRRSPDPCDTGLSCRGARRPGTATGRRCGGPLPGTDGDDVTGAAGREDAGARAEGARGSARPRRRARRRGTAAPTPGSRARGCA